MNAERKIDLSTLFEALFSNKLKNHVSTEYNQMEIV